MDVIEVKLTGTLGGLPNFFGKIGRQVPFAAMRALNDTVKAAQRDYRAELPRVFDRPTAFTLNSSMTRPASKTNLRAALELKHAPATGRSLGPEIQGGARGLKPFERALGSAAGGAFAVPGRGATLNSHGNISRAQIARILESVGIAAEHNAGGRPGASRRRKGLQVRHGAKVYPGSYFVARAKATGEPLGIYRLVAAGRVVPVLIFVRRAPDYSKRLPLFEIVARSAAKNFDTFFSKRLREAVATAR